MEFMVSFNLIDMELVECVHLNEWVTEHYTDFKTNLEFITDKSPEGF